MWWGAAIVVVGWLILATIVGIILGKSIRQADIREGHDVR